MHNGSSGFRNADETHSVPSAEDLNLLTLSQRPAAYSGGAASGFSTFRLEIHSAAQPRGALDLVQVARLQAEQGYLPQ